MKHRINIVVIVFLLLISCKEKEKESWLTPGKALVYFSRIENACIRYKDLWGTNLYGPVMIIDRSNGKIFANQPDKEGLLKYKAGIYTGNYPKENLIPQIPEDFGGIRFAVTPLPPAEDEFRIISHAIHNLVLIHLESSGIRVEAPGKLANPDMDEKEARIWLKLEWHALQRAIESEGEVRKTAIRDALIFRGSNRELYPGNIDKENRFETYFGLATFTHTLVSTDSDEDFRFRLFHYLQRIYNNQAYSFRFGYIRGALYATLLYYNGFDFKTIKTGNFDLGKQVEKDYQIELPQVCRDIAGSLAISYDLDKINAEEDIRLKKIQENVKTEMKKFTEDPVVFLELESPYFDFESENVQTLDTLGILYSKVRISDNWGKLSVDKVGCLISNNFKFLRISARGIKEKNGHISGDGWILILNNDWEIARVNDNFFLRQRIPLGNS
ncbi:MAG: hypothetical protein WCE64_03945 [Bacteroidales bacterium]